MKIAVLPLFIALASCAAGGGAERVSPASNLTVSAETPLAEIPVQDLAEGQCGMALWQRTEPARRIAFITNRPPAARIVEAGRTIEIARTGMEGDLVFGHAPKQRFAGAGQGIEIDVKIEMREGLTRGAVVSEGILIYSTAQTGSVVLPVTGIIGCR